MTIAEINQLIQTNAWKFAKTMPQNPHEYTLKKNWQDPLHFEAFVMYIREHGVKEKYGKTTYTYLYLDGWKYWSMGAPLEITILINRAKA